MKRMYAFAILFYVAPLAQAAQPQYGVELVYGHKLSFDNVLAEPQAYSFEITPAEGNPLSFTIPIVAPSHNPLQAILIHPDQAAQYGIDWDAWSSLIPSATRHIGHFAGQVKEVTPGWPSLWRNWRLDHFAVLINFPPSGTRTRAEIETVLAGIGDNLIPEPAAVELLLVNLCCVMLVQRSSFAPRRSL